MNGGMAQWPPPQQQAGWQAQQAAAQQKSNDLDLSFFEGLGFTTAAPAPTPTAAPFAPPAAAQPQADNPFAATADDLFATSPSGGHHNNPFAPSAAYPVPFAPPPEDDNILGALDPHTPYGVDEEPPAINVGEIEPDLSGDDGKKKDETLVLSRADTFLYLSDLENGSPSKRVEAARALKFLAFNATSEYKNGLIQGGFLRSLMQLFSPADVTACEHAASCMYSMAREHAPSKLELVRVGAHKVLAELLASSTASKQLKLNSCAALYAISCDT